MKKRNSQDNEIRDLERKIEAGEASTADYAKLRRLLGRSGQARRVTIAAGELPTQEDFVAQAQAWREAEIANDRRSQHDPLLSYAIDLRNDGDGSSVDDMARSGYGTTSGSFDEIEGVKKTRDFRSPETQNLEILTFETWDALYIYLTRLNQLAEGELEIDNGMGGMEPVVEYGIWYVVETETGGSDVPPGLVDLGAYGVVPGPESIPGESVYVEEELQELADSEDETRIEQLEAIKGALGDYVEGDSIREVYAQTGYGSRLTSRGYMDSTTWNAVFATEQEAIDALQQDDSNILFEADIEQLKSRAKEIVDEILEAGIGIDREKE